MRAMKWVLATMVMIAMGATAPVQGAIIVYTDRGDWEAALSGTFSEETFDDATLDGFTIAFVGSGHTPGGGSSGVSGGELHDRMDAGGTTEIDFDDAVYAFGGNWDLAGPGGVGTGVRFFVLGSFVSPEISNLSAGGFFGIISDTTFSSVVLHEGTQSGSAETYDADNFVFASSAVPEPGTMTLVSLGAFGLVAGAIRRRRQQKA